MSEPKPTAPQITTAATRAVDVVIVNWNAGALLHTCLAALAASTNAPGLNVTIVDNASSDGSADGLDATGLRLNIIRNAANRGFAAACNQGAAAGRAPLLLFLNPDVRVEPDAIARAAEFMARPDQQRTGIAGIRFIDRMGQTARSCARRPTAAALLGRSLFLDRVMPRLVPPHFLLEWDHSDTRRVDQVMGAFLMIRRDLFTALGGFDERFFVYYEDLDLCLRALDRGFAAVHLADAVAAHDGAGTTAAVKDRRLCYEAASRVRFANKWHGPAFALVLMSFIAAAEMPLRIAGATLRGEGSPILRGALLFWRKVPRLTRDLLRSGRTGEVQLRR